MASPDEMRIFILATPDECPPGKDDYTWAVNRTAKTILQAFLDHEELREMPVETEFDHDALAEPAAQERIRRGDMSVMRENVTRDSVSDVMKDRGLWVGVPSGISGGQYGMAANVARYCVGVEPGTNPALMTIDTGDDD